MMRIALTGRNGQVATALQALARRDGHTVVCLARPEFDLANATGIASALAKAAPDIVVSAAAYTAVDRAETEPDLVHAINAVAPGILAAAAHGLGIPLVHLSTDYVYDGRAQRPYVESDPANPLGVYGATKLAGELAVAAATDNATILRTAWVYSSTGRNFVRTMLELARTRPTVRVVCDQFGCPTAADDIAAAILGVATQLLAHPADAALRGTFHLTGLGRASWADLALQTFSESGSLGGPWAEVQPIATADYPTTALRPAHVLLATGKLARTFDISLPDWRTSLRRSIQAIAANEGWRGNQFQQTRREAAL